MRSIKLIKNSIRTPVIGAVVAAITLATPAVALAHSTNDAHPVAYGGHESSYKTSAHITKKPYFKLADKDKMKLDCSTKQQAINQKVAAYKASAQKQLNYLNNFLGMVQGYVTDNSLTVTNYATLQANTASAQASAVVAVNAVVAQDLNCGATDEQHTHAVFNNSVKTSMSALHAYKASLVTLFTAVVNS